MGEAPAPPISFPSEHGIESPPAGILHQTIKLWPRGLCSTPTRVDVFAGDFPAAARTILA